MQGKAPRLKETSKDNNIGKYTKNGRDALSLKKSLTTKSEIRKILNCVQKLFEVLRYFWDI